jgi:pyrroloquinoline-quinone synthase
MSSPTQRLLEPDQFVEWLRREGSQRYHDEHPVHLRMHEGKLDREGLQCWVLNRFYYQTRIPIKDALILSKSDDPAFRRAWIRRIHDHDGDGAGDPGGLEQWLRLAQGVGLDRERVASCGDVLPGVRFACDGYVTLVEKSPLVVAVASSLTEFFAPDLMSKRIAAWEKHYPWVDQEALGYFRARVTRARRDSQEGIAFVVREAKTYDLQLACVQALIKKTEILWHLLDCVQKQIDSGRAG